MITNIIIVAVVVIVIFIFNRLVRYRYLVREAWSGIDVQLKRRHDLIPNIVESVKGYSQYERKTLEEIVNIRTELEKSAGLADEKTVARKETDLSRGLKKIFALSEAYPDLKANRSFLDLQKNLVDIEDQLQMARRYYNGTVRDYNIAVESFPSNMFAPLFRFRRAEFFEIEFATERQAPEVKLT